MDARAVGRGEGTAAAIAGRRTKDRDARGRQRGSHGGSMRRRHDAKLNTPTESSFMKKIAAAFLLSLWFCSTPHAQECMPPADQYIGIVLGDGRCFPWPKKLERFQKDAPHCAPELKGRLESALLPVLVNGEFVSTKECVPIEWLRRFDPPRWMMLDGLEQSVDELKDDVDRLKSKRP